VEDLRPLDSWGNSPIKSFSLGPIVKAIHGWGGKGGKKKEGRGKGKKGVNGKVVKNLASYRYNFNGLLNISWREDGKKKGRGERGKREKEDIVPRKVFV